MMNQKVRNMPGAAQTNCTNSAVLNDEQYHLLTTSVRQWIQNGEFYQNIKHNKH